MADYQLAAMFGPERYAITEASSKCGKTVSAMTWLAERAMLGESGRNYWWVAPIYPQAKMVHRRLKRALPHDVYESNESELTLTLANGAVLWFRGADHPDSLYGEDVYACVIDEATRCKEESWHAVRTTLTATRGPIRIIGNVKGRRNWAYQLARRAEAGADGMTYHKITAHDAIAAGILTEEEIADAERILPAAVFRELYLAEPSDDEGNPFGLEAIRKCVAPLSEGDVAVWGLDLAFATDGDWCVMIGLDADGVVCAYDRWRGGFDISEPRILAHLRKHKAPVLVDATGGGSPVLRRLQKAGKDINATVLGYTFTAQSKQQLMEGLAVAIQQQRVRYPDSGTNPRLAHVDHILGELLAFEYVYTRTGARYSAPDGLHDDVVCALALAVQQQAVKRHDFTGMSFRPAVVSRPSVFAR